MARGKSAVGETKWMSITANDDMQEYIKQISDAYNVSMSAYIRQVLREDMDRKKDVLPKLGKIKDLQAEIRQMEEERKKLEQLVTAMMEKMEEVKKLQEEVGIVA